MTKHKKIMKMLFDVIFMILLLVFAWNATQGRIDISGNGAYLTGDPGDIAAILLAQDFPQNFVNDPVCADPDFSTSSLGSIRFSIIRLLSTDSNYGLGILEQAFFDLVLFYLAFYVLGVIMLQSRWQALLLTIVLGNATWVGWGTFWGAGHMDPLARTSCAALLGVMLSATYVMRNRPFYWPWIMLGFGLLLNIHAPTAIPMAFAAWLGLWLYHPAHWSRKRQISYMLICGICFLLGALSFFGPALSASGGKALNSDELAILNHIFQVRLAYYYEYISAVIDFFVKFTVYYPLFPGAAAGIIIAWRLGSQRQKYLAKLVLVWSIGILVVSLGVFIVDQELASYYERLPWQFSILRGLRLLIMTSMLGVFLGLSVLWGKARRYTKIPLICFYTLTVFVMLYNSNNFMALAALRNINPQWQICSDNANLLKNIAYVAPLYEQAAMALREHTNSEDVIFSNDGNIFVRYAGQRTLYYSAKDGPVYYLKRDAIGTEKWLELYNAMQKSPTAYIDIWLASQSPYLLSNRKDDLKLIEQFAELVWQNDLYMLVRRIH